ncbi:MAG: metal ABC transporter permease [Deinococcota bacterium]
MDILINFFMEPLNYAFIRRGLLALILAGGINAVIGCFVVVRGLSFFGDALAHAVLPGVALSYTAAGGAVRANLFVGGLGAGVLAALLIAFLTRNGRLKEDTAIGLVFVTMFALGIAIISRQSSYNLDLTHILFGSINGISQGDLRIMAALGSLVLLVTCVLYKQFVIISFDLSLAHTIKLPVEGLRVLMLILISITIVASLQAVGIALMLALLITPAATARLLTYRLHHMMIVATIVGILGGLAGFYLSYYMDMPSGASIVLTMSTLFLLVYVFKSLWVQLATPRSNATSKATKTTVSVKTKVK